LAATLTTVGFGDLSPQTQATRGFAIVLLPFGLVIISFGISLAAAQVHSFGGGMRRLGLYPLPLASDCYSVSTRMGDL
jgi:hypothetical protein